MTKVLHYFEPSTHGVPNFIAFLAEHQASHGHQVHVLGPAVRAVPSVKWTNDSIRRSSLRSILASGRRAAKHASLIGADVIHAHSFFAGMAIRLVSPDQPVVYTPHAWAFARSDVGRFPAMAIERALRRRTSRILCVSNGAAEHGRRKLGSTTPIVSIGSAIDLGRFMPRGETTDQPPVPFAPFAVCVGRISEQKGQLTLADLWEREMAEQPLNLVFIGDGHPDIGADEYPRSMGKVHFVGSSNDVPMWLAASEFAIQPSRWEAMSLATVEALACGVAVVATDVAGMHEAIVDGPLPRAGIVVDSIEATVAAARTLFNDSVMLDDMTASARRRAESLFSPERLVLATDREYETAIGGLVDLTDPTVVELRPQTGSLTDAPAARTTASDDSPEVAA